MFQKSQYLTVAAPVAMKAHAAVQQHSRRHSRADSSTEDVKVLKHQLQHYMTAARQLSLLLMHRNKEIEALLQEEMQLNVASGTDKTERGPLIPAVWGKSATEAAPDRSFEDHLTQYSSLSQAAPAPGRKNFISSASLVSRGTATSLEAPDTHLFQADSGHLLPSISWDIHAAAASPQHTRSSASGANKQTVEPDQIHSMAKDDFSGVHFHEAFWAASEWGAQANTSAPAEQAAPACIDAEQTSLLESYGLYALTSDTPSEPTEYTSAIDNLSEPAQHTYGSEEDFAERVVISHSTAGQLEVAKSQVRALQSYVLSMQFQLAHAHEEHTAVRDQLSYASAHVQHLQRAQQAWTVDQSVQGAGDHAELPQDAQLDNLLVPHLRQTEAALHQALLHEEQLMAEVLVSQPDASIVAADIDVPKPSVMVSENTQIHGLAAGLGALVVETPSDAEDAPSVSEQSNVDLADGEGDRLVSTTLSTAGKGSSASKPQQLRHAYSVIAELSARLAQLECCNALLRDQLASNTNDLIKSGPQEKWLGDDLPWDDSVAADASTMQQDFTSMAAVNESKEGAVSIEPAEDLPERVLADQSLSPGLPNPSESAHLEEIAYRAESHKERTSSDGDGNQPLVSREAQFHGSSFTTDTGRMTGTQDRALLAGSATQGMIQKVVLQVSGKSTEDWELDNFFESDGQSAVVGMHPFTATQPLQRESAIASNMQTSSAHVSAASHHQVSGRDEGLPHWMHTADDMANSKAAHMFSQLTAAEERNASSSEQKLPDEDSKAVHIPSQLTASEEHNAGSREGVLPDRTPMYDDVADGEAVHVLSRLAATHAELESLPHGTHVHHGVADSETVHMSSHLAAAKEQNARLAATHAELERVLLHAQHQLTAFSGARSTQMAVPAVGSFHPAQDAVTQAVAEVRSTGWHSTPGLPPGRASAGAVRFSASSQGSVSHAEATQGKHDTNNLSGEVRVSRAQLALLVEQLAESKRCRDSLQQQLLDVGEARREAYQQTQQESADMMAELADSTAKRAWLAEQLADSECCRDHLQQQLLDIAQARHSAGMQTRQESDNIRAELADSTAKLARLAGELAESERCRDSLQQQLLDVGEAKCSANMHILQDVTNLRAEQADSTAKLAWLVEQLADSERCRDSLQQQLLDLCEAKLLASTAGTEPAGQSATQDLFCESLGVCQELNGLSVTKKASPGAAAASCPACGHFAIAGEHTHGTTLETATSEVAALKVAMTQSEAIFLDLEAQLTAAFEREDALQKQVAPLQQKLAEASKHADAAQFELQGAANNAGHDLVPAIQHLGSAPGNAKVHPSLKEAERVAMNGAAKSQHAQQTPKHAEPFSQQVQLLTIQLRAAQSKANDAESIIERLHDQLLAQQGKLDGAAKGQSSDQHAAPAQLSSQQVQLLTLQLRAAQRRAHDAETVIERLHDQLYSQQAAITELQSALTAAGQNTQAHNAGSHPVAASTDSSIVNQLLQIDYPRSNTLPRVAIVEELPIGTTAYSGVAEDELLSVGQDKGSINSALQIVHPVPASSASLSEWVPAPKSTAQGSAHVSPLLVACALIAGQTEAPEELYAIMAQEDNTLAASTKSASKGKVAARVEPGSGRQGVVMQQHAHAPHSTQRMRENPLFLHGSASSSDEESQGSGGEHEAHHRTVRGREAQQIVQRLKSSYLNRSMSAPNAAAISPAGTDFLLLLGKERTGKKVVTAGASRQRRQAKKEQPPGIPGKEALQGWGPGRRRSSRQHGSKPWSLPSLKRALAEQRRGTDARSSTFGVRSSSNGSLFAGTEERDDEVLDTIYANWGDIDQPQDAEEREESREVTQSLVGRCTYLEEALQEAVRQLTDSQAAESRMQSQNSILRAENKALTSRLAVLKQELQRYKPALREQQVAYKPASRTSAARPATAPFTAGTTPALASTGFSHCPGSAEADAEGGTPCSKYAWELQDLHTRMAAAIANIRELEADKAKVARQLASTCGTTEGGPLSADKAGSDAATNHMRPSRGTWQTIAQLQAQVLSSQSSCQAADREIRRLQHALHAKQ